MNHYRCATKDNNVQCKRLATKHIKVSGIKYHLCSRCYRMIWNDIRLEHELGVSLIDPIPEREERERSLDNYG